MIVKDKRLVSGTSLVAQWLRIRQCRGPGFNPCSGKIPHATEELSPVPQLLSLRSRAHEPQLLSPRAATTEARAPRALVPQQEKPPQ